MLVGRSMPECNHDRPLCDEYRIDSDIIRSMLIRMTVISTALAGALAAGAIAAGGAFGAGADADTAGSGAQTARNALVIDASLARDGRDLVDRRLEGLDAEVRLPRTAVEARTNVRYFDELGYTVIVAGADATAAAEAAGEPAVYAGGLGEAVAATR
jgi:hypothetical protein